MSEASFDVGYGRPPRHTRFQKGQSGNPGGKPGPKKRLKRQFDTALTGALDGTRGALKAANPGRIVDAFARKVVLDAVEGRPSAQRLVLGILDGEETAVVEDGRGDAAAGNPHVRLLLGDRYDEFKERFQRAIAEGSGEELLAIAKEFDARDKFPQSGNFSGNFEKSGVRDDVQNHGEAQKK